MKNLKTLAGRFPAVHKKGAFSASFPRVVNKNSTFYLKFKFTLVANKIYIFFDEA
jgi:hypothetical protein